jgi:hypothetical protein
MVVLPVPSASTPLHDHHRAVVERDDVAKSQGEAEAFMLGLKVRLFPLCLSQPRKNVCAVQ